MRAINGWFAIAALTLAHLMIPTSQAAIEVTNEQLRDGLLSLAHSLGALENKLDRHEQRERALGDIIKRGLQTLTKGQKIFEPIRGSLTRLDERISQIETALLNQDTKIFDQQQKYDKAIESIDKWLGGSAPSGDGELLENVKALRSDVNEIVTKQNAKTTEMDRLFNDLNEQMKQVYFSSPMMAPPTQATHTSAWEERTSAELLELRRQLIDVQCSSGSGDNNQTLDAIADMRHEVLTASDKNFIKTTANVREIADKLEKTVNELLKNEGETTTAESFCESITTNVRDIKQDISELSKLEQMLVQMGDNVLSVKRGMEYNVHAITIGVGEAIKTNSKEFNTTINNKFDQINSTILDNHNKALNNITAKIETEISQVWRQISSMYQEVTASKAALTKLQDLTEVYVNGTFATMDSMEGKVTKITGSMSGLDENLNYLLGRLSLVTQEFNQIKTGLGTALENIRSTFQVVQSKMEEVGPGPHKIDGAVTGNENDIDFKLLPQRDAPPEKN